MLASSHGLLNKIISHCIGYTAYLRNDRPHNVNQNVLKSQVKVCLGEFFGENNQKAYISSKRVIGLSSSGVYITVSDWTSLYITQDTVYKPISE